MKRLPLAFLVLALAVPAGCVLSMAPDGQPSAVTGVWLKGDLHVHDDHSSDGSLPRQRAKDRAKGNVSVADQIGQATKMGLQFLPLTDHRTFDQHYDPLWESSSLLLIPGEEANGSPHAIALGGVDSIVQGAARPDRASFAHVQQSIWDAHAQGATWTIAHPDDGEINEDGSPNERASVQGIDLVEIWNKASDIEKEIAYSENRWNAGFRFGVAGASDSHFRDYWDRQGPGFPTTSVRTKTVNERAVLDALRAGRTSLSINPSGPFIEFTADISGHTALGGDEIVAPPGASGRLRINVKRAAGMQVLLYRAPGRGAGAFRTFTPTIENETFTVDIAADDKHDWYRVEVRGMGIATPAIPAGMELKAIASPIFISPAPAEAKAEIPIPADQGANDGALLAAGEQSQFAGFPDIATDAGQIHLVAEVHGEAASGIVYRRANASGAFNGAGQTLSGPGLARFPRIAVRDRDVWVVWQEDARHVPHRPAIMLRHSADGGATWQATQTVRAIEGRAEHPDVAVGRNGLPILVWQEISAGEPFDVMLREFGIDTSPRNLSRTGKIISVGEPDDTRSARYPASVLPAVSVAPDGRFAVAWQDNRTDVDPLWTGSAATPGTNPDDWQIMLAVLDNETVRPGAMSLGAADMADRHPDVGFGAKGELVVAWESKTLAPAGRNLSVLAAVSSDGGATFSAPATLAPDPLTMSERPRLGMDKDGAVRAVWYDSRSADWRWRVMTAVYRKDAGWDPGTLINGRGVNTWPATSGGAITFASTRNAARLQRDPTQQVFLLRDQPSR
jgi:hypothetical protein